LNLWVLRKFWNVSRAYNQKGGRRSVEKTGGKKSSFIVSYSIKRKKPRKKRIRGQSFHLFRRLP